MVIVFWYATLVGTYKAQDEMVGEKSELQYFVNVLKKCLDRVIMGHITIAEIGNFITKYLKET